MSRFEIAGKTKRLVALLSVLGVLLACSARDGLAESFCVDGQRGQAGASGNCTPGPDGFWSDPMRTLGEAFRLTGAAVLSRETDDDDWTFAFTSAS